MFSLQQPDWTQTLRNYSHMEISWVDVVQSPDWFVLNCGSEG